MPIHKSQMHRLMRIAALLKENRWPNSETLVEEFRRLAWEEGLPIECTRKTVLRDMKVLKEEFHCPLAFSREYNGYYLKHHGWDFVAPALLDENEMLAAVIGARVAEVQRHVMQEETKPNFLMFMLRSHFWLCWVFTAV